MKRKNTIKQKDTTWEELKESLNLSPEEKEAIKVEVEIIKATIRAREEEKLIQNNLKEDEKMKLSVAERIEKINVTPSIDTLLQLLYPLGYTLKIVPLKNK